MPFWTAILIDGAVMSSALGIIILGSLAYNPRLWLNDAPPRVRALAPPLTPGERRDRNIVAAMFLVTLIGATAWSAVRVMGRLAEAPSFTRLFTHFLGVLSSSTFSICSSSITSSC